MNAAINRAICSKMQKTLKTFELFHVMSGKKSSIPLEISRVLNCIVLTGVARDSLYFWHTVVVTTTVTVIPIAQIHLCKNFCIYSTLLAPYFVLPFKGLKAAKISVSGNMENVVHNSGPSSFCVFSPVNMSDRFEDAANAYVNQNGIVHILSMTSFLTTI